MDFLGSLFLVHFMSLLSGVPTSVVPTASILATAAPREIEMSACSVIPRHSLGLLALSFPTLATTLHETDMSLLGHNFGLTLNSLGGFRTRRYDYVSRSNYGSFRPSPWSLGPMGNLKRLIGGMRDPDYRKVFTTPDQQFSV